MENTTQTQLSQFETTPVPEVVHTIKEHGESQASDYIATWSKTHACDEEGNLLCKAKPRTYLGRTSLPWNAGYGGSCSWFSDVKVMTADEFQALRYGACSKCREALGFPKPTRQQN